MPYNSYMELTLQKNLSKFYIKSFTGKSFIIGDNEYIVNIIIDEKIISWNIKKSELFDLKNYNSMMISKPDIIILGCGNKQFLPTHDFIDHFVSNNIGIEIMTTESACKTFNILISEQRKVIAGLII